MQYNKLVRDKIPQKIIQNGETPNYYEASLEEFNQRLKDKLLEEVKEYIESESPDEIADILEVLDTIIIHKNFSPQKIQDTKKLKKEKRGGFSKKYILTDVN